MVAIEREEVLKEELDTAMHLKTIDTKIVAELEELLNSERNVIKNLRNIIDRQNKQFEELEKMALEMAKIIHGYQNG